MSFIIGILLFLFLLCVLVYIPMYIHVTKISCQELHTFRSVEEKGHFEIEFKLFS
jgi:hypothetical protein